MALADCPSMCSHHVPVCSEMEAQDFPDLLFLPMGFSSVAVTSRNHLSVSGHVSCPYSFRNTNHGIPTKAHGYVLKVGFVLVSRRSVISFRSLECVHGETLLADNISKAYSSQHGMTISILIKVHLQVFLCIILNSYFYTRQFRKQTYSKLSDEALKNHQEKKNCVESCCKIQASKIF